MPSHLDFVVSEIYHPGRITTTVQLAKLRRFTNFSTLIYCPSWFSTISATSHLMLLKFIMDYAKVDKLVSNSAEKALLQHLWYIVPKMILLSLLSSMVSTTEI